MKKEPKPYVKPVEKVPLTKEQIKQRKALIFKWVKLSFQGLIIIASLFLAMFSGLLFGDSEFGEIITRTLGKFFDIGSLISNNYLRILETFTVLLFVWIIQKLYAFFIALFVPKVVQTGTTMQLLNSGVRYLTGFAGVLFTLSAWGVDSVTILASVGLIGVIVSFGAQSIIEDIKQKLYPNCYD
jgi:small conductance mechanosensitive channel